MSLKGIFRWYICSLLYSITSRDGGVTQGDFRWYRCRRDPEQYSTDQSPPGLLGIYKRLDGIKGCEYRTSWHWVVVFTLTDRASTIPSNIRGCQSGTWSQRGTKVNGSHHGDNPLLRPTGIQIATKSYATLQAMAPTNSKTVHQTSFTPYREQPRSTRIVVAYPRQAFSATNRTNTFQPVLINNSKFLKATHRTKIRKIEIPRSMVVEALSC